MTNLAEQYMGGSESTEQHPLGETSHSQQFEKIENNVIGPQLNMYFDSHPVVFLSSLLL